MRPARILVLRGGAIGDFIVTIPALQALRDRWPDGHIELIGYPHVASLAKHAGILNEVRSLNAARIARLFAENAVPDDDDQAYYASFDIVISFLHDPDAILAANLKRYGVQVLITASPLVTSCHAVDHFNNALTSLAIYDPPTEPRLSIAVDRSAATGRMPVRWAAIHPGSGGAGKIWPVDRFIKIAERLRSTASIDTVFVTGDADTEYIPDLDRRLDAYPRLHNVDLTQLAGRLAEAAIFVGNDAGISHLAAAVGVPTLALFGPTDPALWAPRGPAVHTIRADGGAMERLDVDTVWKAVKETLTNG